MSDAGSIWQFLSAVNYPRYLSDKCLSDTWDRQRHLSDAEKDFVWIRHLSDANIRLPDVRSRHTHLPDTSVIYTRQTFVWLGHRHLSVWCLKRMFHIFVYCFRQPETFAYARHKLIIVSLICIPCKYIREYIVVSFPGSISQSVVSCPSLRL